MNVFLAISLILAVASVYMFTVEVFSVALKLTGMATSKIRFQVASLFTGVGFTTQESELITNDDRRRKIAIACAYTGHIFSVVIMGLVINVFFSIGTLVGSGTTNTYNFTEWYFIVLYIAAGLFFLVLLIKIPPINRRFQRLLERIAIKSSRHSRNTNIITVLDTVGKHAIVEVVLNRIPDFAKDVPLFQMGLTKKFSINLLSIRRGTRIIDVTKDTMFRKGDSLVIFALLSDVKEAFINSIDKKENAIIVDQTNEITLINNYGSNALVEVFVEEVPKELDGVKMKDSHLPDRFGINVAIIKRNDEYIFTNAETVIQKGDLITIFGPYKNIKLLFKNDEK